MAYFSIPVGFSFIVEIIGDSSSSGTAMKTGFKEVSGINVSMATETVIEGGENRFVHKLPGRVQYDSHLELKRGLIVADSPFGTWCRTHFAKGMNPVDASTPIQVKNVILHLLDVNTGEPLLSWAFARAFPVKWEASGFNSQQSEIVVESLSLAYAYFVVL